MNQVKYAEDSLLKISSDMVQNFWKLFSTNLTWSIPFVLLHSLVQSEITQSNTKIKLQENQGWGIFNMCLIIF